jgi:hypothetical protein
MDKVVAGVFLLIVFAALYALLAGVPVYFLWNWLMPTLFKVPAITVWQAMGLSALSSFLFKSASSSSKGSK